MKKALYGTTALVAAGALMSSPASAEEKIKLGLGGYMNMYFGAMSTDNSNNFGAAEVDRGATNLFQDGEVWFKGETTLDNGITFGANVQLEAFSPGDQIDESYGYISGSFGRVVLGSENSAAYLMHYAAPGVGVPVNSGWVTTFVPADNLLWGAAFRTPNVSTNLDLGNDERRVTYFTPRFGGFQVGASYTPTISGSGDGTNLAANVDTQFHDAFEIGANFVQSFNGFDIAVSGGYHTASAPDLTVFDDSQQYQLGLNVGFAGFTVGASYANQDDDVVDGDSWDVGATYATGPWTVGVTYFQSDVTYGIASGLSGVTNELQALSAGISYAVGPGIEAAASVLWADMEDELVGTVAKADGVGLVVGLTYSF